MALASICRLGETLAPRAGLSSLAPDVSFLSDGYVLSVPGSMYLCYLDESGTVEAATTSHFILLGLALPATAWKEHDREIERIKARYDLVRVEIHTAWMMRKYPEQHRIRNFATLGHAGKKLAVQSERKVDIGKAMLRSRKAAESLARNYKKTNGYVHLTYDERVSCVRDLASAIGLWPDAVLFADAQQKAAHVGEPERCFDFAFEQVVTRFQHYLRAKAPGAVGLLVQDNNQTAAKRLTNLMRRFHEVGTKWAEIDSIIETPLFVDSQLTSMVQMADLCSYAVRRFFENGETDIFDRIYERFDRAHSKFVGLRHYTGKDACSCRACKDHGR
jgi:hypothetical protein